MLAIFLRNYKINNAINHTILFQAYKIHRGKQSANYNTNPKQIDQFTPPMYLFIYLKQVALLFKITSIV